MEEFILPDTLKKIASIDVGLKRIGVAFCFDGSTIIPQKAIIRKNRVQASNELLNILKEFSISLLVVGIPKGGASEEEMGRRILHFISLVGFDGQIEFIDESFSSFEAKEFTQGEIKQKKDGKIDSISALIILERWLFSQNIKNSNLNGS